MESDAILFYSHLEDYGCFSNHYPSEITLKGKTWPTTEHYFHAMKFEGTPQEEVIRNAETSHESAQLGRSREYPMRSDWESIKYEIMKESVRAKFTQHSDLRDILLATNNRHIVEHTDQDRCWGDGGDGSGTNWLGKVLMEVREELRT
jgi:ribA/ribD-fused uncharacterized protein